MSNFSRITKSTRKVPKLINPKSSLLTPSIISRPFAYENGPGGRVAPIPGPGALNKDFQKPLPVLPEQQQV